MYYIHWLAKIMYIYQNILLCFTLSADLQFNNDTDRFEMYSVLVYTIWCNIFTLIICIVSDLMYTAADLN